MSTGETIGRFLESPDWTEAEKWVIRWQFNGNFHLMGSFYTALFDAIKWADEENLARLALGFPAQVASFRLWAFGDLGRRLREAGLDI